MLMLARTTSSSNIYYRHVSCSRQVQGRGGFSLAAGLKPTRRNLGYLQQLSYLIPFHILYFKLYYENSAIRNTNTLFYMICSG